MKRPTLVETHPEIAAQMVGGDPSTFTQGSGHDAQWLCPVGHTYVARISHRTGMGSGCPFCANKKVLAGFNDCATTHPSIAAESIADPTTFFAMSNKKHDWLCSVGHVYVTTPNHRAARGDGCPFCSGRKFLAGLNDLVTVAPTIADEVDGDPSLVKANSQTPCRWVCPAGHSYEMSPANRTINNRSCPECPRKRKRAGFDADMPSAKAYILRDERLGVTKAGVTHTESNRVAKFGLVGLAMVAEAVSTGRTIKGLESELIATLHDVGSPISKADFIGAYGDRIGGHTETVHDPDGAAMRAALELIDRAKETPSLFAVT